MVARELYEFGSPPSSGTLVRCRLLYWRSNTKMSKSPLVSPGTRSEAPDVKATKRPSPLIVGMPASELSVQYATAIRCNWAVERS